MADITDDDLGFSLLSVGYLLAYVGLWMSVPDIKLTTTWDAHRRLSAVCDQDKK